MEIGRRRAPDQVFSGMNAPADEHNPFAGEQMMAEQNMLEVRIRPNILKVGIKSRSFMRWMGQFYFKRKTLGWSGRNPAAVT